LRLQLLQLKLRMRLATAEDQVKPTTKIK
jgi:hypothetical protein